MNQSLMAILPRQDKIFVRLLFYFPSLSSLYEHHRILCRSFTAASITAILHYNATLAPQDNITALAGMLALSGSVITLNDQSTVTVSPAENPPKPQLVPEVWYTALAHCKVGTWNAKNCPI